MHKVITVPARDELLARLTAVSDEPHHVEQFYPHLLKAAGRDITGPGIANTLILSATTYTAGFDISVLATMNMLLHKFAQAFTDDAEVLADTMAHFRACNLPTG